MLRGRHSGNEDPDDLVAALERCRFLVEYEEDDDPKASIPKVLDELRELIA